MSTSYQPRYPESHLYDSLTDLLSDGFPEDTPVYVFQDGTPTATTCISDLRTVAAVATYTEAPDGHGASCLWLGSIPVLTEHDVPPGTWPDFVRRMTGTTITTDDATVAAASRVAEFLRQWAMMRDKSDVIYGVLADPTQDDVVDLTVSDLTAVLAALTGVPHD